jgi:hypothetical protein
MHEWEAIAARLEANDESALCDAIDILQGVILKAHCPTMALVFRGLVKALDGMQEQLDREGWKF